jgi:hypothetical protein
MSNVEAVHRFPQRLAIRVPAGLPAAVEAAARRQFTSPSEWARRALLDALRSDGVHIGRPGVSEIAPESAPGTAAASPSPSATAAFPSCHCPGAAMSGETLTHNAGLDAPGRSASGREPMKASGGLINEIARQRPGNRSPSASGR